MLSSPFKNIFVKEEDNMTPPPELQITSIKDVQQLAMNVHTEGLVTTKSDLHDVIKFDGIKKTFTFTLRDSTGNIEVAVFDSHPDFYKIYYYIFPNKCYRITNCYIKDADNQYSMTKNIYELHFSASSTIEFINDYHGECSRFEYPMIPINQVEHKVGAAANILGVCVDHSDLIINEREGRPIMLREIFLLDQSGDQIQVTLWENEARKFDTTSLHPIVYVYGARVKEYNGQYHLGTVMNTMIMVNPNIEEAHELRRWFTTSRKIAKQA